jgi:hypothetical protein
MRSDTISIGLTVPLDRAFMAANREAQAEVKSWRDSSARKFLQFASDMSRALDINMETVMNTIANSDPGSNLKEHYLASLEEKKYLKKIGLEYLIPAPRKAIQEKFMVEINKLRNKGMSASHAWAAVQAAQPELYEAYCYVMNTRE